MTNVLTKFGFLNAKTDPPRNSFVRKGTMIINISVEAFSGSYSLPFTLGNIASRTGDKVV